MKILVISLLRLGDFFLQAPLMRDLHRRYPDAEIDVLVNPGTLAARELFPEISRWHVFERDRLQKDVGTAEVPLFAPVRDVAALIETLSARRYSLLLNFTHNRLSAHLAGAVTAGVKQGLIAEGPRFRPFENRWLRQFNEKFGGRDGGLFHYTEWLAGAFGLEAPLPSSSARGNRVLIQPLTSDAKKNWSVENWKAWLSEFRARHPELRFSVLGAPFEEEFLRRHFEAEDLEISSLTKVRDLLSESRFLVTGDTSIKHLAALENVPVLEIALGSSDPWKVGPYQAGAAVLSSRVSCAPCPSVGPCRRMSHECGEEISVARVLEAAEGFMASTAIPSGASRVLKSRSVGWMLRSDSDATEFVARSAEKLLWRLFLEDEKDAAPSRARLWMDEVSESAPDWNAIAATMALEQDMLERIHREARQSLQEAANLCLAGNFDPQLLNSLRRQWGNLRASQPRLRWQLQELSEIANLPFAHPLAFFGHGRRVLDDLATRLFLRNRILNVIKEHGGVHERLSRKLPERGPEAT